MLIFDTVLIGSKLLKKRKEKAMTQAQVAEKAGLSDRTYADIERGTVNMRTETLLHICAALNITPNDVLTEENNENKPDEQNLSELLKNCSSKEKENALKLISFYLNSLL